MIYSVQGLEAEDAYLRIKHWLEQNNGYAYAHFIEREFTKLGATSAVQLFINERNLLNRASSKRIEIENKIKSLNKTLKKKKLGLGTGALWGFYAFSICWIIPFLIPFSLIIAMVVAWFGILHGLQKDSEEKEEYRKEKRSLEYSYNGLTAREIVEEE